MKKIHLRLQNYKSSGVSRVRLNRKKLRLAGALLLAAGVLTALYFALSALELRLVPAAANAGESYPAGAVLRDGERYHLKRGLTTLLVLGIDETGPVHGSGSYNNTGQADFIALLLFDSSDQSCRVLQLDRDTMAEIPVLGVGGQPAGTVAAQLALSYTYGSGLADSCENAVRAVSNFLYGVPVQHYLSLRMDAVAALCDLTGGVPVEIGDDFSAVDNTLRQGETVTLTGRQALTYIRARGGLADQTNQARMARQRQFFRSFANKLCEAAQADTDFPRRAFAAAEEYMVTDLTAQELSGLSRRFSAYTLAELVTPAGEAAVGEEFMEFHAEETALQELVLRLFYKKQSAG